LIVEGWQVEVPDHMSIETFPHVELLIEPGHLKIGVWVLGLTIEDFICCVANCAAGNHKHENDDVLCQHSENIKGEILIDID